MAATLKDLAPAEKRKVAGLIRQVVDKERQVRELEAALAAAAQQERGGHGGPDRAAGDDGLEAQNRELARENTS